jgi:AbrB family looped-hinge helix DNA binding protein
MPETKPILENRNPPNSRLKTEDYLPPRLLPFSIDRYIVLQEPYRWSSLMEVVTVSPKYQVVIPRRIRDTVGITPGQKFQVFIIGGRIELVPMRQVKKMRGFLRGIDTGVPREDDRL